MDRGRLSRQVGHLLRVEREKARLTQAALARDAGTTQQCVSQLETGRYAPTTAVVEKLFAALGWQLRLDVEPLEGDLDELIEQAADEDPEEVILTLENLRICGIPTCRRYSERWRDFSGYDVDPARPGPLRWWTPFGELAVRLLTELPSPVNIRCGDHTVPVRPLADIERDDEQVARVLRRGRAP